MKLYGEEASPEREKDKIYEIIVSSFLKRIVWL
jgi:hypothetical protein